MIDECIFCKIIEQQLTKDEEIIFETENCIVLLDKYRVTSAGPICLVITKKHFTNIFSTPDDTLKEVILTIKRTAEAINESLCPKGIRIWQANGKSAGQSIFHLHFHIVPTNSMWDRLIFLFPGIVDLVTRVGLKPNKKDNLTKQANKLREVISNPNAAAHNQVYDVMVGAHGKSK